MNTREVAAEYRLAHWSQIMHERKTSGMSVKAYCESAGFHESIYYYWQRKLREAACRELREKSSSPKEIHGSNKLRIPNSWSVCEAVASEAKGDSVLIEIGQCRVTATAGVESGLLAKVCRVLTAL